MSKKVTLKCDNCGTLFQKYKSSMGFFQRAKTTERKSNNFCCIECKWEHGKVTQACAYCGAVHTRRRSKMHSNWCCSSECANALKRPSGVIVNDELRKEIKKMFKTGFSYLEIAEMYGIASSTVWAALKGKGKHENTTSKTNN